MFEEHVDIYFARQLINEKLKEATEEIPKGLGIPELAPVSTGLGEVYQYILYPKKVAKINIVLQIWAYYARLDSSTSAKWN